MKRRAAIALALWAFVSTAAAAPADTPPDGVSEVLLRAMTDELKRTVEQLRLEQLAAPYFVAETVEEQRSLSLEGSFGAIRQPRRYHTRMLKLELRVGSREFDDNHFVPTNARSYAPMTTRLPVEDDYDALRYQIWSLTDRAYKQALDRLSKKEAYRQRKNITDLVPDLSEDPVQSFRETIELPEVDEESWSKRLRGLSALFRDYPRIRTSHVRFYGVARHTYFVDSEGRNVVKPTHQFEIRIGATGQADDGMEQTDELRIVRRSPDRLPSPEQLAVRVRELASHVTALTEAPRAETYLGPVLLEGQAAGEFFSQLLADGVSDPRPVWVEAQWAERYFKPGSLVGRIGLRVISPSFDVYDDPTRAEFEEQALAGHYKIDDQGIPARRVELIRAGILTDLLMGRSPIEERSGSNGHGRASLREPVAARIGNLFVSPSAGVPADELKRRLREEARAFGLDHGIMIRRISYESGRNRDALLSEPVLVYRVDVETGEEQLLRDADFRDVTLRALRDIVAASTERHVHNINKQGNSYFRGSSPSSIVHPSVLVAEMELAPSEKKPERLPYLPRPHFGEK
jgi:predicted Zn-dependent protease